MGQKTDGEMRWKQSRDRLHPEYPDWQQRGGLQRAAPLVLLCSGAARPNQLSGTYTPITHQSVSQQGSAFNHIKTYLCVGVWDTERKNESEGETFFINDALKVAS